MINRRIISIGFFIIASVLMITECCNGFGASIAYSMQDPLTLSPGQSSDIAIGLQSFISEGDLIVVPEILEGKEIIEITDGLKEYHVTANQDTGADVHLRVSIPDNANPGKEYAVILLFKDITKREGGMVGFSSSIGASFKVLVAGKPGELKTSEPIKFSDIALIIIIAIPIVFIIAILIIIFLIIRKKK